MTEKIHEQPAREPRGLADTGRVKYALGRRFFLSQSGHFGLAPPNAKRGDQIAVLFGAETPFVLRRAALGFQVVGESYTHGYMHGEAIEQCKKGAKQAQNIALI